MPTGKTYIRIASQTLSSASASVTFSNLPQGYTDLVLVVNSGTVVADGYYGVRFNSDTNTNYSNTQVVGNGSTATSNRNNNSSIMYIHSTSESTVGRDTIIVNIQNYSNNTTFKTALTRGNSSGYRAVASVNLWRSTSAITSMQITAGSNLLSGSTFTIYGIECARSPKASGGDIVVSDGAYWYHAFRSSGTFVANQTLTADVLQIAGGGAGGGCTNIFYCGAGGGAGGVSYLSSQSLTGNTTYSVTIGAGGAGQANTSISYVTSAQKGSNSQFGSLTAAVGGGAGSSDSSSTTFSSGGSGGGLVQGASPAASGTAGQGNNGGTATSSNAGAGGGGAGAVGGSITSNNGQGGLGGAGTSAYSAWAYATSTGSGGLYAGGGGGGHSLYYGTPSTVNNGGSGGGGKGGYPTSPQTPGGTNTGSGGGGGGANGTTTTGGGASGGSGIVIVRYAV